MGRGLLPVRHARGPLVLDRRDPGHALPRHRDDAVLLHLEDPLGPRLPPAPVRRIEPGARGRLVRVHDRSDERHQHVLDGAGDEGGARLGHQLQHLGLVADGRRLRRARRAQVGDLQRGAPVRPDLGRSAADPDPGPVRGRRLERLAGEDRRAARPRRLHARLEHARPVPGQPDGGPLDGDRLRPRLGDLVRLLDDRLPGRPARARGQGPPRRQDGPDHRRGVQDDGPVHRDPPGPAGPGALARQTRRRSRGGGDRRPQLQRGPAADAGPVLRAGAAWVWGSRP